MTKGVIMSRSTTQCSNCGKTIFKEQGRIKGSKNNFCDKECKKQWHLKPETIKARFMHYVNIIDSNTWLWTGSTKNGYGQFGVNGVMLYTHRISYELFIGEIPEDRCVLHGYDDNRLNICPKNLWLGSKSDNSRDCVKKGRGVDRSGSKHGQSKLTEDNVIEIRKMHETNLYTHNYISKMFGVSRCLVTSILNKRSWLHI